MEFLSLLPSAGNLYRLQNMRLAHQAGDLPAVLPHQDLGAVQLTNRPAHSLGGLQAFFLWCGLAQLLGILLASFPLLLDRFTLTTLHILLLLTLSHPLSHALCGVNLLAVLPHLLLTLLPHLLSDAVVLVHIVAMVLQGGLALHLLINHLRHSARRASKNLLNLFV